MTVGGPAERASRSWLASWGLSELGERVQVRVVDRELKRAHSDRTRGRESHGGSDREVWAER